MMREEFEQEQVAPSHEELLKQVTSIAEFAERVKRELQEFIDKKAQSDGTESV